MPELAKSSRRIGVRTIAIVVALLTVFAAFIAGTLAPYYLAVGVAQTSVLALAAAFAFAAIVWLGMRLSAALWPAGRPARYATITSGALTVGFVAALYMLVLRPGPLRYTEAMPLDGAKYWQLSTGSTVSYQEYLPPADIAVKPEPLVFLHGGPGLRFAPFDSDIYGSFAADGFRVYLYDQAGSGASALFPHIREYSVARAVADLEAIRLQLHAERMILIGHSWGSTLAASYMAKYPTRVSKVVFHSPGAIWDIPEHYEYGSTDAGRPQLELSRIPFRLIAGLYLMQQNPDAAERLLPQREAEELMAAQMAGAGGTLVCKGDSNKLPPVIAGVESQPDNPGFNPYVLQRLVDQTNLPQGDPHAALRGNRTPAILLVGECNFIPWRPTLDYRQTFANLKIFYIPKAGHYLQFEQPDLMTKVIRSFLLDQPDLIPPYAGDADPRPPAISSGVNHR